MKTYEKKDTQSSSVLKEKHIARKDFWDYFFHHNNNLNLFFFKDSVIKEKIFNEFLSIINFESSSYCNRKCPYCPVSYEGSREQRLMQDQVFDKIVMELQLMDYKGIISLSLFNEPLAAENIIDRIERITTQLPSVFLTMNSNGDFLNKELLDKLCEAGLKEIFITCHMESEESYSDQLAYEKLKTFFKRVMLPCKVSSMRENHNITCDMMYRDLHLLVETNKWMSDGCDRGGKVAALSVDDRRAPCASPFREIAIDVDGNFRMCCNMYVTTPAMKNVLETSILDFYFSDDMNEIRKEMVTWDKKRKPCSSCNTFDYSMPILEREWERRLKESGIYQALIRK